MYISWSIALFPFFLNSNYQIDKGNREGIKKKLSRMDSFGNNSLEHKRRGPEGDVKIKKF